MSTPRLAAVLNPLVKSFGNHVKHEANACQAKARLDFGFSERCVVIQNSSRRAIGTQADTNNKSCVASRFLDEFRNVRPIISHAWHKIA